MRRILKLQNCETVRRVWCFELASKFRPDGGDLKPLLLLLLIIIMITIISFLGQDDLSLLGLVQPAFGYIGSFVHT